MTTSKEAWELALETWDDHREETSYTGDEARAFRDGYNAAKAEQESAIRAAKREAVDAIELRVRKLFTVAKQQYGALRQALPVILREELAKYPEPEVVKSNG